MLGERTHKCQTTEALSHRGAITIWGELAFSLRQLFPSVEVLNLFHAGINGKIVPFYLWRSIGRPLVHSYGRERLETGSSVAASFSISTDNQTPRMLAALHHIKQTKPARYANRRTVLSPSCASFIVGTLRAAEGAFQSAPTRTAHFCSRPAFRAVSAHPLNASAFALTIRVALAMERAPSGSATCIKPMPACHRSSFPVAIAAR